MLKYLIYLIIISLSLNSIQGQNSPNRQVVLQGFWWDFKNNQYLSGWSNYLTELAPRLKALGIDAVWIPPTIKSANKGVGYNPFDHYDLGDKFQKGGNKTSMGDKDELLRMIAVLKANGLDVIQDVVINHLSGAGSFTNQGGQDPMAIDDGSTSRYKNFRYVCFATPESEYDAENYLSRAGRFHKNWQNFYPNNDNACCTNDLNTPWWGPDVSYEENAFGLSSNAIYNPVQEEFYMKNGIRSWLIWYKKQLGFDGIRIDAVKHFPADVMEDFLWNLQNNSGFANQGDEFYAVGEYVDSAPALDAWCDAVQNRAGTFDFNLRFELSDMVKSNGTYNLGNIPNVQQNNRGRTSPFVNNHDTFRPLLESNGDFSGDWDLQYELSEHISPDDPRRSLAYAIILALDGSPLIFFEDLFDIGTTGMRFNHDPKIESELPLQNDMENLLWCHQNLGFKEGEYLVRWQSDDLLAIERSGKAIICMNDSWDNWQDQSGIQTNFPPGTILKDYSGAAGTAERTVEADGTVFLSVPPCNGSALGGRRGYNVWAPVGISESYTRPAKNAIHEWEMSNDLGDSHPNSLQQGGGLPSNSTECRQVGKIFSNDETAIKIDLFPNDSSQAIKLYLLNQDCEKLDSVQGLGHLQLEHNPAEAGWKTISIANADLANIGQEQIKVRAEYRAPQVVQTEVNKNKCSCLRDDFNGIEDITEQINIYPNPSNENFVVDLSKAFDLERFEVLNAQGQVLLSEPILSRSSLILNLQNQTLGLYYLRIIDSKGTFTAYKLIKH